MSSMVRRRIRVAQLAPVEMPVGRGEPWARLGVGRLYLSITAKVQRTVIPGRHNDVWIGGAGQPVAAGNTVMLRSGCG